MSTIFSKIHSGEIPGQVIAENEHAFAIVDKFPIRRGHILIIPKREIPVLDDLPKEEYVALMLFARTISQALLRLTKAKRIGKIVEGFGVEDHAHLHLVPLNGPGELDMSLTSEMPAAEMAKFAQEFRNLWEISSNS